MGGGHFLKSIFRVVIRFFFWEKRPLTQKIPKNYPKMPSVKHLEMPPKMPPFTNNSATTNFVLNPCPLIGGQINWCNFFETGNGELIVWKIDEFFGIDKIWNCQHNFCRFFLFWELFDVMFNRNLLNPFKSSIWGIKLNG